jgi:hypothetical protein
MAETPGTSDLQRLIGELRERLRPETASRAAVPPAGEPPASARAVAVVAPGRPLDDADVLDLESVQRGRLQEALLYGGSPPASARAGRGRGLWAGVAVAAAIALCVGLAVMVQAAMAHGTH